MIFNWFIQSFFKKIGQFFIEFEKFLINFLFISRPSLFGASGQLAPCHGLNFEISGIIRLSVNSVNLFPVLMGQFSCKFLVFLVSLRPFSPSSNFDNTIQNTTQMGFIGVLQQREGTNITVNVAMKRSWAKTIPKKIKTVRKNIGQPGISLTVTLGVKTGLNDNASQAFFSLTQKPSRRDQEDVFFPQDGRSSSRPINKTSSGMKKPIPRAPAFQVRPFSVLYERLMANLCSYTARVNPVFLHQFDSFDVQVSWQNHGHGQHYANSELLDDGEFLKVPVTKNILFSSLFNALFLENMLRLRSFTTPFAWFRRNTEVTTDRTTAFSSYFFKRCLMVTSSQSESEYLGSYGDIFQMHWQTAIDNGGKSVRKAVVAASKKANTSNNLTQDSVIGREANPEGLGPARCCIAYHAARWEFPDPNFIPQDSGGMHLHAPATEGRRRSPPPTEADRTPCCLGSLSPADPPPSCSSSLVGPNTLQHGIAVNPTAPGIAVNPTASHNSTLPPATSESRCAAPGNRRAVVRTIPRHRSESVELISRGSLRPVNRENNPVSANVHQQRWEAELPDADGALHWHYFQGSWESVRQEIFTRLGMADGGPGIQVAAGPPCPLRRIYVQFRTRGGMRNSSPPPARSPSPSPRRNSSFTTDGHSARPQSGTTTARNGAPSTPRAAARPGALQLPTIPRLRVPPPVDPPRSVRTEASATLPVDTAAGGRGDGAAAMDTEQQPRPELGSTMPPPQASRPTPLTPDEIATARGLLADPYYLLEHARRATHPMHDLDGEAARLGRAGAEVFEQIVGAPIDIRNTIRRTVTDRDTTQIDPGAWLHISGLQPFLWHSARNITPPSARDGEQVMITIWRVPEQWWEGVALPGQPMQIFRDAPPTVRQRQERIGNALLAALDINQANHDHRALTWAVTNAQIAEPRAQAQEVAAMILLPVGDRLRRLWANGGWPLRPELRGLRITPPGFIFRLERGTNHYLMAALRLTGLFDANPPDIRRVLQALDAGLGQHAAHFTFELNQIQYVPAPNPTPQATSGQGGGRLPKRGGSDARGDRRQPNAASSRPPPSTDERSAGDRWTPVSEEWTDRNGFVLLARDFNTAYDLLFGTGDRLMFDLEGVFRTRIEATPPSAPAVRNFLPLGEAGDRIVFTDLPRDNAGVPLRIATHFQFGWADPTLTQQERNARQQEMNDATLVLWQVDGVNHITYIPDPANGIVVLAVPHFDQGTQATRFIEQYRREAIAYEENVERGLLPAGLMALFGPRQNPAALRISSALFARLSAPWLLTRFPARYPPWTFTEPSPPRGRGGGRGGRSRGNNNAFRLMPAIDANTPVNALGEILVPHESPTTIGEGAWGGMQPARGGSSSGALTTRRQPPTAGRALMRQHNSVAGAGPVFQPITRVGNRWVLDPAITEVIREVVRGTEVISELHQRSLDTDRRLEAEVRTNAEHRQRSAVETAAAAQAARQAQAQADAAAQEARRAQEATTRVEHRVGHGERTAELLTRAVAEVDARSKAQGSAVDQLLAWMRESQHHRAAPSPPSLQPISTDRSSGAEDAARKRHRTLADSASSREAAGGGGPDQDMDDAGPPTNTGDNGEAIIAWAASAEGQALLSFSDTEGAGAGSAEVLAAGGGDDDASWEGGGVDTADMEGRGAGPGTGGSALGFMDGGCNNSRPFAQD
jgi:hypothetical protein